MFFALYKLKIVKTNHICLHTESGDKMSFGQFMYFIRSVRSPIFNLLVL